MQRQHRHVGFAQVRLQVAGYCRYVFGQQQGPHVGEAVQLLLDGLGGVQNYQLLGGAEVVTVHQHQVLVLQQLGLTESVQGPLHVEAGEGDFVGQLGGGAGLQDGVLAAAAALGCVIAGGVVGVHVGHAQGISQQRREAGSQLLDAAAGGTQNGQLVAAKLAAVGAGQLGVLAAGLVGGGVIRHGENPVCRQFC